MLYDGLHRSERQSTRVAESARALARSLDYGQLGELRVSYPIFCTSHSSILPLDERDARATARPRRACGRIATTRVILVLSRTKQTRTTHLLQRRRAGQAAVPLASCLDNVCRPAHVPARTTQDLQSATGGAYQKSISSKRRWRRRRLRAKFRKVSKLRPITRSTNLTTLRR